MSGTDTTTAPDEFAGLEAQAAGLEQAAVPVDPSAPAPGQIAEEAAELVEFAAKLLVPLLPDRYGACYGDRQRKDIGQAFGALCEKHGWSMAGMMGKWGPEIALITAMVGPVLPVVIADIKARNRQRQQPAPIAPRVPEEAEGVRP